MALRDHWQRVLTEIFTPEFGPEIAAELAALPHRQRRERMRAWYQSRPSSSFLLLLPNRWHAVHFKLSVLHTIATEQGQNLTPGAAASIEREISALETILATQEAELPQPERALFIAEEHLRRAERALAYASKAVHDLPRPLSIEGEANLQSLRSKTATLLTQKNRVHLLLDDFERFHDRVAEEERPNVDHWLERLRTLYGAYEDIVNRMKEVLRAEEEVVRQGFTADLHAFDRFDAELAALAPQYAELRRRSSPI